MKLSELAQKPRLIAVVLDDEDTMAEHGESVEFWTWDRQPMHVFMKLANINADNATAVIDAVRDLVLTEQGDPVLTDGVVLPTRVMMRVLTKVVENLGKS